MTALRSGLVAFALLASLSGPARAQFVTGGFRSGGYPAYPGYSANNSYYNVNSGFGNYGLPGSYPGYRGYGVPGYGPGAPVGGYFRPAQVPRVPQTYNNMGGLIGTIRSQTGRGNSFGYGSNYGIVRRRNR